METRRPGGRDGARMPPAFCCHYHHHHLRPVSHHSTLPCTAFIRQNWQYKTHTHTHAHTRLTAQVSRYQKDKTNLEFTVARDSEWQWHQLGHMQVCTSLRTDNHASTPPLSFFQAGRPSCRPTNSVKALKASW